MFGPHVGPLELMAIAMMALATGVAWLIDNWCRRRGGRGWRAGRAASLHASEPRADDSRVFLTLRVRGASRGA